MMNEVIYLQEPRGQGFVENKLLLRSLFPTQIVEIKSDNIPLFDDDNIPLFDGDNIPLFG